MCPLSHRRRCLHDSIATSLVSQVSTLEWLVNRPLEQITGRAQFSDPVEPNNSADAKMSAQILELRNTYFKMKALCPSVEEPGFCWEQVDNWDIAVELCSKSEASAIGGSKARYSSEVRGLA